MEEKEEDQVEEVEWRRSTCHSPPAPPLPPPAGGGRAPPTGGSLGAPGGGASSPCATTRDKPSLVKLRFLILLEHFATMLGNLDILIGH